MKRLSALIAFLPGAALAHGVHAPVPETLHGAAHLWPVAGLVAVAVAIAVAIFRRDRE